MNKKYFEEIIDEIGTICDSKKEDAFARLFLITGTTIEADIKNIEPCFAYVRIYSSGLDTYTFVPYENIVSVSC